MPLNPVKYYLVANHIELSLTVASVSMFKTQSDGRSLLDRDLQLPSDRANNLL